MNIIDRYLKKVADTTDDEELRDGIEDVLDTEYAEFPHITRPKSSFKEANKKMKEIEDERNR